MKQGTLPLLAGLAAILAGFLCFANPPALAESNSDGKVVVDWSEQLAGEPPPRRLNDQAVSTSWGVGKVEMLVVDANTDPPSPLPEGRPALLVTRIEGDAAAGGIFFKPFANPPLKGWMEFETVLDETFHLSVWAFNESESFDPADAKGKPLFGSTLRPNDTVSLRVDPGVLLGAPEGESQYLGIPVSVASGVPTRYRIVWDFESDPAKIAFVVHGEWGGDPYAPAREIELNPGAATSGMDAFRIIGSGVIGNVWVSAGD
jgi:hypothetical protein